MLLGQNLGRGHQGALLPGRHALGRSQGGHHGFARAHIALQQPVHGHGARQIVRNFFHHPALRRCQLERQRCQQLRRQSLRLRLDGQHGGAQRGALLLGLGLRQLLRQQFLGFQPLPSRMGSVFQLRQGHIGRGVVQKMHGLHQGPDARDRHVGRHRLFKRPGAHGA